MNEQLVNPLQINKKQEIGRIKAQQGDEGIETNIEKGNRDGCPKANTQVKDRALVMYFVRRPHQRNPMAQAMEPVFCKVQQQKQGSGTESVFLYLKEVMLVDIYQSRITEKGKAMVKQKDDEPGNNVFQCLLQVKRFCLVSDKQNGFYRHQQNEQDHMRFHKSSS